MQKIANENDKFNIKIYKKLKENFGNVENLYNESKKLENLNEKLKNANINQSIIRLLIEDNIKEEVNKKYTEIIQNEFDIITLEDKEYPLKCNDDSKSFCIIINNKINLKNSTIYIYYQEYFTKFAKNITNYFSKILNKENCNVICEYEADKLENIQIKVLDIFSTDEYKDKNFIIFPNINSYYNYILNCISFMIIIEARYEDKIVKLVNYFLEQNKDIYVVPSNVFRKNSYFSNYLIKQGADVILNKQDLKYIVNNITC